MHTCMKNCGKMIVMLYAIQKVHTAHARMHLYILYFQFIQTMVSHYFLPFNFSKSTTLERKRSDDVRFVMPINIVRD